MTEWHSIVLFHIFLSIHLWSLFLKRLVCNSRDVLPSEGSHSGCISIMVKYFVHHCFDKVVFAMYKVHQFSSVQSLNLCPTFCNPMNRSTPGLPVRHQLLEFTQIHIHRVSDAIQPSHPLSPPSPPAPNPSQHQSLFQWVNSSHEVAKVLELQL